MSVTAGESPATLRPQLYLAGSLTNEFKTFGSSYRLIEYSNNGMYRETDLQSNWFGKWESLIRIKTKI